MVMFTSLKVNTALYSYIIRYDNLTWLEMWVSFIFTISILCVLGQFLKKNGDANWYQGETIIICSVETWE